MKNIFSKIQATLLYLKASSCLGKGDFDKVIELALKAKALWPQCFHAHLLLCSAYEQSKQYGALKEAAKEALSLAPEYPEFGGQFNGFMVVALYHTKGSLEEALPYCAKYLKDWRPINKQLGKMVGCNDELYQWIKNVSESRQWRA